MYRESRARRALHAFTWADLLRLELFPTHDVCGALLVGDAIYWDPKASDARTAEIVLREVARWLLRRFGLVADTAAAVAMARSIDAYGARRCLFRVVASGAREPARSAAARGRPGAHQAHRTQSAGHVPAS